MQVDKEDAETAPKAFKILHHMRMVTVPELQLEQSV